MKTEEEIKEKINKLKVHLNITAKHHDKYVDLYTRDNRTRVMRGKDERNRI